MPRLHQPRCLQARQRLTHHRTTDAFGLHDVHFGGELFAALENAVAHALGKAVDQGFGEAARLVQWR
ncbi:hypothetical protein D3C84_1037840 [compost metagenome]